MKKLLVSVQNRSGHDVVCRCDFCMWTRNDTLYRSRQRYVQAICLHLAWSESIRSGGGPKRRPSTNEILNAAAHPVELSHTSWTVIIIFAFFNFTSGPAANTRNKLHVYAFGYVRPIATAYKAKKNPEVFSLKWRENYFYTVSQKTSHLWLAIIFTFTVRLRQYLAQVLPRKKAIKMYFIFSPYLTSASALHG